MSCSITWRAYRLRNESWLGLSTRVQFIWIRRFQGWNLPVGPRFIVFFQSARGLTWQLQTRILLSSRSLSLATGGLQTLARMSSEKERRLGLIQGKVFQISFLSLQAAQNYCQSLRSFQLLHCTITLFRRRVASKALYKGFYQCKITDLCWLYQRNHNRIESSWELSVSSQELHSCWLRAQNYLSTASVRSTVLISHTVVKGQIWCLAKAKETHWISLGKKVLIFISKVTRSSISLSMRSSRPKLQWIVKASQRSQRQLSFFSSQLSSSSCSPLWGTRIVPESYSLFTSNRVLYTRNKKMQELS